jgi:TnpA family transposase
VWSLPLVLGSVLLPPSALWSESPRDKWDKMVKQATGTVVGTSGSTELRRLLRKREVGGTYLSWLQGQEG